MGTYRSPEIIKDKTAAALSQTSAQVAGAAAKFASDVENIKKLRQIEDNKANKDLYDVNKAIGGIPSATDKTLDDAVKSALKTRMDKLYQMGRKVARGGDNEEYLRFKAETEALVKKIPNQIQAVNINSDLLDKGVADGKMLIGTTAPELVQYLSDWNEEKGAGGTVEFVGTDMILKDKSGIAVDTGTLLRSVEQGGGLQFVRDPMDNLKATFEGSIDYDIYKKLDKKVEENNGIITSTVKADYRKANEMARNAFDDPDIIIGSGNDPLAKYLNQNNWDYFIAGNDPSRGKYDDTHKEELHNAILDRMMSTFAKEDIVLKSTTETPASKSSSGSGSGSGSDDALSDQQLSRIANDVIGDESDLSNTRAKRFIKNIVTNIDPNRTQKYQTGSEIAKQVKDDLYVNNPNAVFLVTSGKPGEMIFNFDEKVTNEDLIRHFKTLKKVKGADQSWANLSPNP